MRIALRLLLYPAILGALAWLLPLIAASLNRATDAASTADASRGYALFAIYLLVGTLLGVSVAWDVSRLLGDFAGRLFVGSGSLPSFTPVLWKADRLVKQGEPVKALEGLRDHLRKHPRAWFLTVRVADIYQNALHDPLSAVLEYEALLEHRLPRRVRAEVMVRLAACRLHLRDAEGSTGLLEKVIERFPRTPAARTAARRLKRMREA